jgi:hypothetical protein
LVVELGILEERLGGNAAPVETNPATLSFSMTAVVKPSWEARIAATYPPGPLPITHTSICRSAMRENGDWWFEVNK